MLTCETDSRKVRREVKEAAYRRFSKKGITAVFEHGQWWVSLPDGSQYSVNDAEGGDSVNGFCFEQVTEADED